MAYELCPERNVLVLFDKLSNQDIELYYDLPPNAMRIQFSNAMSKRRGAKIVVPRNYLEIQAQFGARLINGFKKGPFAVKGQLISSDQEDAAYYKDWKLLLSKVRADLFAKAAQLIFAAVDLPDGGVEFEGAEDLENPDDFLLEGVAEIDQSAIPAAGEVEAAGDPLSAQ